VAEEQGSSPHPASAAVVREILPEDRHLPAMRKLDPVGSTALGRMLLDLYPGKIDLVHRVAGSILLDHYLLSACECRLVLRAVSTALPAEGHGGHSRGSLARRLPVVSYLNFT
jgi:hypothetical protein